MKHSTEQAIIEGLQNARDKFPSSTLSMAALTEEVGELAKALLDSDSEHVCKEAIQVAVMAIRVLEEGDDTFTDWRQSAGLSPHPDNRTPIGQ